MLDLFYAVVSEQGLDTVSKATNATNTCYYLRRRIHDDHLFTNKRIEYKHATEAL
jgi:hypothetical protein